MLTRLTKNGWINLSEDENISKYTAVVNLTRHYEQYFQSWKSCKCSVTLPVNCETETIEIEDNHFEYIHLKTYQAEIHDYPQEFPVDYDGLALPNYSFSSGKYVQQNNNRSGDDVARIFPVIQFCHETNHATFILQAK